MAAVAGFQVGDIVRRGPIPGGAQRPRLFRLTLVNSRVFSAESADDQWSGWGGPIGRLHSHAERICGRAVARKRPDGGATP